MHATIESNGDIVRTLGYHELKVEKKIAECIYANNFIDRKSVV